MSTTLDRRKAQKNYAEFDEYISYQLQKTQTGIRSTDIFTALCGAAVFVVSYLLVFVIFDHWVVTGGFGPGMRIILLSGLLIGTLVWLGWKVVWPFFRRVNSLYAARALEQASPDLKSTLINYVDLRSANRDVSPAIIESMERRAAVTLSHAEVDDAIDRSTLLRLSYALLTAVVLFSVYAVASPKKVWPSIVRIFAPGSEVSVSTQTTFLKVDPGDTTILAREFLTITADLSGEVPQEVTLLYTTADGQFVDEPSPMREVEAGLKRYRCILKGNSGEGLLQGLSYRIVAGDASTRTYNVKVSQPPSATVTSLHYSFPDYMELPPEQPIGSGIDTWEGTHIQITATANMPVSSARLQFSDEAEFPARCEEMLMTVADDGVTLTPSKPWQPIIRDDGTYPGFYRIQCRTRDGATDPAPVVHSIRLQADQKPDASTLQPNRDMEVAANAIVPLLIQASDPDFRLSRVILRMKNGSRSLADRPLLRGGSKLTITDSSKRQYGLCSTQIAARRHSCNSRYGLRFQTKKSISSLNRTVNALRKNSTN
jgi:collagen type III alpha